MGQSLHGVLQSGTCVAVPSVCVCTFLIVRAHRHGVSSLFSNRLQSSTEAAPLSWHSSRSPTTVLTHFRYDYLGENVEIRDVDIATHTSSERQQRKLF